MRSFMEIQLVDTVAGLRWGAVLGLYHAAGDADDVIRDLQEVREDGGFQPGKLEVLYPSNFHRSDISIEVQNPTYI